MSTALLLTFIGMTLVFAAIGLLWLLMEVVVRLAAEREPKPQATLVAPPAAEAPNNAALAAAVAVAVALALAAAPAAAKAAPTAQVSAWQAAMRAQRLHQRGPVR